MGEKINSKASYSTQNSLWERQEQYSELATGESKMGFV